MKVFLQAGGVIMSDDRIIDFNELKNKVKETDIDKKLKELLDEFAIGKDCTPEDCKNCPNNIVCNFSLPPQAAEKHEVKIRKKIIPSEAQQTIIDWAKDIAAQ